MKICFNIQAAVAQRAGIGRYTRLLAEHLVKMAGKDDLSFFYFDFLRKGLSFPLPGARAARWCPGRLAQLLWKTANWPPFEWFAGEADLYHFPNFIIPPLGRGKSVVTIHDVSFLRYPEFAESRNLAYMTSKLGDTIHRADAIVVISHFTAEELGSFFPEARGKINVIYPGLLEHMGALTAHSGAETRRMKGLHRPYILMVGTLEPRKNMEFLIQTYEHMKGFHGELVVVGRRGWQYEPIIARLRGSSRAPDIRLLENVEDHELPAVYSGAELFLFPSRYEGFGFPPLEAMACGVPVMSSAAGALKEALGDGALLIDHYDAARWARAAELLIADKQVRQLFIDKGRLQASKYTWVQAAEKTMELYRRIVT